MLEWFRQLDRVLRGEATRLPALREGRVDVNPGGLSIVVILLGCAYGFCMGSFSVFSWKTIDRFWQLLSSTIKVPALFFLTLAVTFPSLYVFNALVGSRLTVVAVLRLLVTALGVILAVLASFGPIVAFFSVSTSTYAFMVLLNVAFYAAAGFLGLAFLLQTLHRMTVVSTSPGATNEPLGAEPGGALEPLEGHVLGRNVRAVFQIWIIIFGLVGAQMGWVLRPFIGNPNEPFSWLRHRESNFFVAVWNAIESLFK